MAIMHEAHEASHPPTMVGSTATSGVGTFVPRRCTPQELQEEILNILQLQQWASEHSLAPSLRSFINLGAEDGESLQANRKGFSNTLFLCPRVLRDVSDCQTNAKILQGRVELSFPLCIAPFAGCRAIHPDGEAAVAQAAAEAGIVYTVPNWAATPVADIVTKHNNNNNNNNNNSTTLSTITPLFFQIYPHKPRTNEEGIDRQHLAALLKYLASFRIVAVIITCDTVNNSNREKTYKSKRWLQDLNKEVGGFPEPCALPDIFPSIVETGHPSSMTWKDIKWMKGECQKNNLALILKGIMTKEDTKQAVQAGVDAIVVSNHGGRQLDGTLGTIEVLEECVQAAAGSSMEVFVDGGIRRGKDMAKCIAIGAKCVFVGRPILWGLAAGGQDGVTRALTILREEFLTVLQLLGCQNPQELSTDHVQDRLGGSIRETEEARMSWMKIAVCAAVVAVVSFGFGRASRIG